LREERPLYKSKNGTTYLGEWIGSKKDGFGVKTWTSGAWYEGTLS
jgi:hypothetical protein